MTFYDILGLNKHLETDYNHKWSKILIILINCQIKDFKATMEFNKQTTDFKLDYCYLRVNKHKETENARKWTMKQ